MRHSSLPAHCHSPSVIRDKKTYGTWTRLESLGVCVAYPDSQINQMPRDGQGSSLCENTLLMSLFLSTSSSPVLRLSRPASSFLLFLLSFSPLIVLHSHLKHRGTCWSLAVEEPVSYREGGKTDRGVVCGPRLNA